MSPGRFRDVSSVTKWHQHHLGWGASRQARRKSGSGWTLSTAASRSVGLIVRSFCPATGTDDRNRGTLPGPGPWPTNWSMTDGED